MILNTSSDVCKLDRYPEAYFSRMYEKKLPTDPACVKSRNGFFITFAYCPVYWASKLQTETALSTTKSEINDLAHSCRELFPIIDITKYLGQAVGLPIGETKMNV